MGYLGSAHSQPADLGLCSCCAMPVISLGSQIFDLAFHPTASLVYTGLLNGKVKAFTYDEQGTHSEAFSLRISKRSCRGLALNPDGSSLYAVGKNRTLQCVSTSSGLVWDINNRAAPLTLAREPYRRHARVCTSECYGPAGASMNPVYPAAHPSIESCALRRTSSRPATTTVQSR